MDIAEIHGRDRVLSWVTLFASVGTLVCCALPITLVTLGFGAAVVSLTSSLPVLIVLSQHKTWVFVVSALLLAVSGWMIYRPGRSCPTEPESARLCTQARTWNRRVYWASVLIWGAGFFAAYLALPVRLWFES